MIKTLLLDTFLLMGIIWMLISIVYFCIRLDRLLSSMEKPVVETMEETAEVVLSEEDTSSSSVHSDFNSFEDYRNRFLHTSYFTLSKENSLYHECRNLAGASQYST